MESEEVKLNFTLIVSIVVYTFLQVLLWFPCYIYQQLVLIYVRLFRKDFGKILEPLSVLICDNFYKDPLNSTLTVVLQLENPLDLKSLQNLFSKNVLQATTSSGLRYPELQQYQTTFMGYKFWRNDPTFKIQDHVFEKTFPGHSTASDSTDSLAQIHESLINRPYPDGKSPWELVLLRDSPSRSKGNGPKTFLAMRIHHAMADARSIVKLVVEGIGQKKLKTAEAKPADGGGGGLDKFLSLLLVPYNLVKLHVSGHCRSLSMMKHPWWIRNPVSDTSKSLIDITTKIPLSGIKQIAKRNNVRPAAVIMSGIIGGVQKFHSEYYGWKRKLSILCTLPKENHPPTLTNHAQVGYLNFPLDDHDHSLGSRLQSCNKDYCAQRTSDAPKCLEIMQSIVTTCASNTFTLLLNVLTTVPTGITNIAGEEEGFSVGDDSLCEDFTFGGSLFRCSFGVVFAVFSYKGYTRVSVWARESIMKREQLRQLTRYIEKEFAAMISDVSSASSRRTYDLK